MYDFSLVVMRAEATSLSCFAEESEETRQRMRKEEERNRGGGGNERIERR